MKESDPEFLCRHLVSSWNLCNSFSPAPCSCVYKVGILIATDRGKITRLGLKYKPQFLSAKQSENRREAGDGKPSVDLTIVRLFFVLESVFCSPRIAKHRM